ncbi:hypothetical protein [Streptosporangium sp. NPDC000396]|uniref:hypothetical protein n=1 Tax=Streptosporangium sp. NPDC000396 TaxID=3366185 RepID=UPI0036756EE5
MMVGAPEGFVETVGDWLQMVRLRVRGDLERFKAFIEARGGETGGWRGDVPGPQDRGTGTGHGGLDPDAGHLGGTGRAGFDEPAPPRTVGQEYPPESPLPPPGSGPLPPVGRRPGEEPPPAPGPLV